MMQTPAVVASPKAGWVSVAAPALFVFLWATGFIVARYGMPHAPPLAFLSLRFALAAAVLLAMAAVARAAWPGRGQVGHLIVSGLLIQAGYLSGVWCAVRLGMPAGVSALIVNLQPVLTAAAGPWLGEHVSRRQWAGLALGLAGVVLVVANKMSVAGLSFVTVVLSVFSLLSITGGTLYQKRFCPSFDLRTGVTVQYAASFAVVAPLALWLEEWHFDWNAELIFAMAWSVLALSVGAIFLMFTLIRRGAATKVASLFYLVPVVTAVLAWALFGETFTPLAGLGLVATTVGVAIVQKR